MPRSPIELTAELLPARLARPTLNPQPGPRLNLQRNALGANRSAAARLVRSGWAGVDGALFASDAGFLEADAGSLTADAGSLDATGETAEEGPARPDLARGGLVRGGVHEWLGAGSASGSEGGDWSPPLLLLTHLAGCAARDALERGRPATVLWIGRRVWPYPRALFDRSRVVERGDALARTRGDALLGLDLRLEERPESPRPGRSADDLAGCSLFVDPGDDDGRRLWAIDTALRSPGVTAIVADGSSLGMAATRRLQLAAAAALERGGDAPLALLARPASEAGEISAATTRWAVRRSARRATERSRPERGAAEAGEPRWSVDLIRVKGAQAFRPPARGSSAPAQGSLPPAQVGTADLRVVEPDEIELRLGRTA